MTLSTCASGDPQFMSHSRLCSEIITRTARAVGGEEALARVLKEDPQDVKAWARGTREAPLSVYIKALDLLAKAARNNEKS
jgi:hypothetical protein